MADSPAAWPAPSDVHTIVFDFDGVFTDNAVWVDQEAVESVRCDRRDGLGIGLLKAANRLGRCQARLMILSKEPNPVVLARARKIGLECHHGVDAKREYMVDLLARSRPGDPEPARGLIMLGNDLNDLPLMRFAGFSVAPADAHPRVRAVAGAVLEEPGGHGFVRAFVERFLQFENLSGEEIDELVRHC